MITRIVDDGCRIEVEWEIHHHLLANLIQRHISDQVVEIAASAETAVEGTVLRIGYTPRRRIYQDGEKLQALDEVVGEASRQYADIATVLQAEFGNYAERETVATLYDCLHSRLNKAEQVGDDLLDGSAQLEEQVAALSARLGALEKERWPTNGTPANGKVRSSA